MPSKNEIKFIRALAQKKTRAEHGVFIAEGEKLVKHLISVLGKPEKCFATNPLLVPTAEIISDTEMRKLSFLKTPSSILAVFKQPTPVLQSFEMPATVVLDGIRDPGNLGTILRLCDWFGIRQVVCTTDCVDVFNEKVVQASMGSVAVVEVMYADRASIIKAANANEVVLLGADMNGEDVFHFIWPQKFGLVIGNEGQGLSAELGAALQGVLSIPAAPIAQAESLNAAMATAIMLGQYASKVQL